MPLCLGSIQLLQLATKEHNNSLGNDVDDEDTGNAAVTDVMIAVEDDTVPQATTTMTGMHPWLLL